VVGLDKLVFYANNSINLALYITSCYIVFCFIVITMAPTIANNSIIEVNINHML